MIPCGGRGEARNDFLNDHGAAAGKYYVALLIDSEESVSCINETWQHLETFFNWQRPQDAQDDQVLFMTRCMETWIAADRSILREHFGDNLQVGALPEFDELQGVSPGMLENRLKIGDSRLPRALQQRAELVRCTGQAQSRCPGRVATQLPKDASGPERQAGVTSDCQARNRLSAH